MSRGGQASRADEQRGESGGVLAADEGAPTPELIAGRYRVAARLATGGMGTVYRVFDRVKKHEVALKRMSGDDHLQRRTRMFEREFYALAGLKHPGIIEVYDYGCDRSGPFYTMELLDGRDLREVAPLPYRTACACLRDVASSLALLHARGLVHRDLSARNVRVTASGRAKLIDFGTLADFGRNKTRARMPWSRSWCAAWPRINPTTRATRRESTRASSRGSSTTRRFGSRPGSTPAPRSSAVPTRARRACASKARCSPGSRRSARARRCCSRSTTSSTRTTTQPPCSLRSPVASTSDTC